MNKNNALIIFLKAPRFGWVKTRLQPEFSPAESLVFYKAMVEDLIDLFKDVKFCDLKLYFSPQNSKTAMEKWLGKEFDLLPQNGENLGDKMHNAFVENFKSKYKKVVLIGSDIPTLDVTTVIRAFTSLDNHDVTLGPCIDGGYYLIGLNKPDAALFQDIEWSTERVLQQTINKVKNRALELNQLELKYDIDRYSDIKILWDHLEKRNLPQHFYYRKRTFDFLNKLFEKKYSYKLEMEYSKF
ncbi:TIGR04282 family arsenosugar biosynthesis glycosyltransferase [candidate division KSB1 bacterium]|nr:TIGR04282 family arsenosugar biosynthesis glycosyltransferase [candidate division KSB1 bacterium]